MKAENRSLIYVKYVQEVQGVRDRIFYSPEMTERCGPHFDCLFYSQHLEMRANHVINIMFITHIYFYDKKNCEKVS